MEGGTIGGFTIEDFQLKGLLNATTPVVILDSGQSANFSFDGNDASGIAIGGKATARNLGGENEFRGGDDAGDDATGNSNSTQGNSSNFWVISDASGSSQGTIFKAGQNHTYIRIAIEDGNTTGKLKIRNPLIEMSGSVVVSGSVIAPIITGSVIRSAGDVIAFHTSDERLKDNIKTIDKPIYKLKKLRGVEYEWNDKQNTYPSGSLDSGIIAQDVKEVLPQLVKKGKGDYLGVRHDRLVGLLIEAVKEQQNQIDEMKEQIKELKDGSS